MLIGLYAHKTFGKTRTEAYAGLRQIIDPDTCSTGAKDRLNSIGLDMLVAPEYTNITKEEAISLSEMDPWIVLIPGSSLIKEGNRIFNRAFILNDGKVKAQYDKIAICAKKGYSDIDHYDGELRPGESFRTTMDKNVRPCIFQLDDINPELPKKRAGLEICSDNEWVLKQYSAGEKLDLHIILACGLGGVKQNATKLSGHTISVDGDMRPTSSVYGKSSLKHSIPIHTADGVNNLEVYWIRDS